MNDDAWKIDWAIGLRNSLVRMPPEIIVDANLTVQHRVPRSKKKRIRKKWARNPDNFRADNRVYQIGNGPYICNPATLHALNAHLRREGYIVAPTGTLA